MKKMILESELQASLVENYSSFITDAYYGILVQTLVFRDLFCMFTFISRL